MSEYDYLLSANAESIVAGAPTEDEIFGYLDVVQNQFLGGIRLSMDMDLEDSVLFTEQLLANISKASGYNYKAETIQTMAQVDATELDRGAVPQPLVNEFVTATSVAAIGTAPKIGNIDLGGGLPAVPGDVLVQGLTGDAATYKLAASSVCMGSSFLALSGGGMAFGPLGAIGGFALAGVSYLLGSGSAAAAQEAFYKHIASQYEAAGNQYLESQWKQWSDRLDELWDHKDKSIRTFSDAWTKYELSLGVRFGLRYFPGDGRPKRAGAYYKTNKRSECDNVSGCLYFPEPDPNCMAGGKTPQQCYVDMLNALSKQGQALFTAGKEKVEYVEPWNYSPHFDRAIRAFEAWSSWTRYPPGSNGKTPNLNKYGTWLDVFAGQGTPGYARPARHVGSPYVSWVPKGRGGAGGLDRAGVKGGLQFPNATEVLQRYLYRRGMLSVDPNASTSNAASQYTIAQWLQFKENDPKFPKFAEVMQDFVQEMEEELARDWNGTSVVFNRLMSDLLRTANSVAGELVAALRLKRVENELGTLNLKMMSAQDLRSVTALSDAEIKGLRTGSNLDNLVLGLGLGAVGVGAYAKWGKKGRR